MKQYNQLTLEIYTSGTTPLVDSAGDFERIQGLTFDTQYPGGIYGACSFFLPRPPMGEGWLVKPGQRLVIRNGVKVVYEGYILDVQPTYDEVVIGDQINCVGAWAHIAMVRGLNRRYVDNRLTDDIWTWYTAAAAAEKAEVNRETRLRITPKNVAWATNNDAYVKYICPTGETIKKIISTWTLAGANFEIVWYDTTNGESIISAAAGGPTAATYTPATDPTHIYFGLKATGNSTPASDGTVYGQINTVTVYATTSNTGDYADTLDKIAADIALSITSLNADIAHIATSGSPLTLSPFVSEGYEMIADILTRAADKGDAAGARWACYLDDSEKAATPDGKPVLVVEAQPLLTDYDYIVYYDSLNLVPSLQTVWTTEDIANWIVCRYTDADGREQYVTPSDTGAGALTDATSVAAWGRREIVLDTGDSQTYDSGSPTSCNAYNAGVSYLAAYKNPRWKVNSSIVVAGYIENKNGSLTPASEIRAGKRVKLGSYAEDNSNNFSGTWLTFLISQTSYDDESQQCSITIGPPPELNLPTFSFPELPPVDEPPEKKGGGGSGGGGKKKKPKPKPKK